MILCQLHLFLGRLLLLLLVASVLPLVRVLVLHLSAVVNVPIAQHLFLIRKTGKDRKFKFPDWQRCGQQRGEESCNGPVWHSSVTNTHYWSQLPQDDWQTFLTKILMIETQRSSYPDHHHPQHIPLLSKAKGAIQSKREKKMASFF